jgi:hypothetical protein
MTGFWDWSSDITLDVKEAVTGKKTTESEVYRKPRQWAPHTQYDLDGYPVVVSSLGTNYGAEAAYYN